MYFEALFFRFCRCHLPCVRQHLNGVSSCFHHIEPANLKWSNWYTLQWSTTWEMHYFMRLEKCFIEYFTALHAYQQYDINIADILTCIFVPHVRTNTLTSFCATFYVTFSLSDILHHSSSQLSTDPFLTLTENPPRIVDNKIQLVARTLFQG